MGVDAYLHRNISEEERKARAADSRYQVALTEKQTILYTGFIAQEVEKAARETGFNFSGVSAPAHKDGIYSLRYAEIVVPLVKAVQEQQQMIAAQNKKIEALINEMELLKAGNRK